MNHFALMNEPIDVQLTVHFNNYEYAFGKGSFKHDIINDMSSPHINNLLLHYGFTTILAFLDECVYFKQVG